MTRGSHGRGARGRRPGGWRVRGRVERFNEPLLLLLLRERPTHGYELLEQLESLAEGERVDVGNLYRVLRSLEEDGLVRSEWNADLPGPAKRTYRITDDGLRLLDEWAEALGRARARIDLFLERYRKGGEHVPRR